MGMPYVPGGTVYVVLTGVKTSEPDTVVAASRSRKTAAKSGRACRKDCTEIA